MAEEWRAICKDCQKEFGYSDSFYYLGLQRGRSRPERCLECRSIHRRAMQTAGASYYFDKPPLRNPTNPSALGMLWHPPREHGLFSLPSKIKKYKFGITENDIGKVYEILKGKQVLVVVGPTGSGKSTYLPACLVYPPATLELDDPNQFTRYGQIIITQPRIQAAVKNAKFIAEDLLGCSLNPEFDVGYKYSRENRSSSHNKLAFITDGTLINWIINNQLSHISTIMIDEAHERSLNIDLILGLLKQRLSRYPNLRLIISSATIESDKFVKYFGGKERVGFLSFKGKLYDVEVYLSKNKQDQKWDEMWKEVDKEKIGRRENGDSRERKITPDEKNQLEKKFVPTCIALVNQIARRRTLEGEVEGDILGFLPTVKNINKAVSEIRQAILPDPLLSEIDVFALHAQLPMEEQNLALRKKEEATTSRVIEKLNEAKNNPETAVRIVAFVRNDELVDKTTSIIEDFLEENPDLGEYKLYRIYDESKNKEISDICNSSNNKEEKVILMSTFKNFERIPKDFGIQIIDRRIIVATNIAETSLTVDGILYVVDSGLIFEDEWDPKTETSGGIPHPHSQAGCKQRWGRAGRIMDGKAYCLYTEEQFDAFETYTAPQIKRSCLDEVVLAAKTAGIDDILTFDWLEPPLKDQNEQIKIELRRAEDSLKKRGALDIEGDITEHGMELRSFGSDPIAAELVIMADQFACAVEMCTLIPMFECKIQGELLRWNDQWDAPTQQAVEQIHRSLTFACKDDVELCLKLYQAWANGDSWEGGRRAWSDMFMVNHEIFEELIHPEREQLLSLLSKHKKEDERRPIDFDLLDRLRIVMAACLQNNCYIRTDRTTSLREQIYSVLGEKKGFYAIFDTNTVIADRENLPEAFVCYKRRKGGNILKASMIADLSKDWLTNLYGDLVNENKIENLPSRLKIAQLIASISRESSDGPLKANPAKHRLFVDQFYPINRRYKAIIKKIKDGDAVVKLGKKEDYSIVPTTRPSQERFLWGEEADAERDFRIPPRRFMPIDTVDEETIPSPIAISDPTPKIRIVHAAQEIGDVDIILDKAVICNLLCPGEYTDYLEISGDIGHIRVQPAKGEKSYDVNICYEEWRLSGLATLTILPGNNQNDLSPKILIDCITPKTAEEMKIDLPSSTMSFVRVIGAEELGLESFINGQVIGSDYFGITSKEEKIEFSLIDKNVSKNILKKDLELIPGHYFTVIPFRSLDDTWQIIFLRDGDLGLLRIFDPGKIIPKLKKSEDMPSLSQGDSLTVQVISHELDSDNNVIVRVAPVEDDLLFGKFKEMYMPGDVCEVKAIDIGGDFFNPWLVVQEKDTRYRVVMDGNDIVFNVCPAILKELMMKNIFFEVIVESIDCDRKRVELSRLPFVEADLDEMMKRAPWDGYAQIVDKSRQHNFLSLWDKEDSRVIHGVRVEKKLFKIQHDRRSEYPISVDYPTKSWKLIWHVPEGLERLLLRQPWKSRFSYDSETRKLTLFEPMRYAERALLLAQCGEPWYRCAIDELYRASNKLEIKEKEKIKESRPIQKGRRIMGMIHKVTAKSAIAYALIEGIEVEVIIQRRGYIGWKDTKDAREVLRRGEEVDLVVLGETKDGESLRARQIEEDDPILKYKIRQRVSGVVKKVNSSGIYIEIDSNMTGRVERKEVSWCVGVRPEDVAKGGERIEVVIHGIDLARRLLNLSCRLPEKDPSKKYSEGTAIEGRVMSLRDFGVIVEIEPGIRGLLHKSETSWRWRKDPDRFTVGQKLKLVIKSIEEKEPRLIFFTLDRSHRADVHFRPYLTGKLIGRRGATINALQQKTDTDIDIDRQKGAAVITGSKHNVEKARREIEKLIH